MNMALKGTKWIDGRVRLNSQIVDAEARLRNQAKIFIDALENHDDVMKAEEEFLACKQDLSILRQDRNLMLDQSMPNDGS